MSNSLDPDQAQRLPDLGPNCLQRFLADATGRERVEGYFLSYHQNLLIMQLCGVNADLNERIFRKRSLKIAFLHAWCLHVLVIYSISKFCYDSEV